MKTELPLAGEAEMGQTAIHENILREAGGHLPFLQLFLRPASAAAPDWTWDKALHSFRHSVECKAIQTEFKLSLAARSECRIVVLDEWFSCVCGWPVADTVHDRLDARYFWRDRGGNGHSVGGFIDTCVLALIEEDKFGSGYLTNHKLVDTIRARADNRAVQSFLTERSVLASLTRGETLSAALRGYHLPSRPAVQRIVTENSLPSEDQLMKSSPISLYTPSAFNYEGVDGVIRIIHQPPRERPSKKRKTMVEQLSEEESGTARVRVNVDVIGVQVVVARLPQEVKRRTAHFLSHLSDWTDDFGSEEADVSFSLLYVGDRGHFDGNEQVTWRDITVKVSHVDLHTIDAKLAEAVGAAFPARVGEEVAVRTVTSKDGEGRSNLG